MSNSKFQKKFSYILLFSILCSFALYFSNKSLYFTSENLPTRVLQEEDNELGEENIEEENTSEEEDTGDKDMKDICSNGPDDLFSYYYKGLNSIDTSPVESTKSEAVDALISIIEGNDLGENAKTYGMSALKWIIFIGCAILMIIGWIVCIICMCCNCCCCTCCCKKKICNIAIFLLCAGCYATVFVLSTHSFVAVKNAMKGMNGASCSLLQFIHEIIDGQSDKSQTPYWIGIDGINKVLNDVSEGIQNTITHNADNFFYHKKLYDKYIEDSDNAIKYADKKDKGRIAECFQSIPKQLSKENKKFQYSVVRKGGTAAQYAGSLQWVEDAGIISRCYNLTLPELPLDGNAIEDIFKVYMKDTGLLISMLEDGTQFDVLQGNLYGYKGAIFENLIADFFAKMGRKLYYYHKDSGLEIDFVIRWRGECTLVEVKAETGNAKSAATILKHPEKYHVNQCIKLGNYNVGRSGKILTLPLYMGFLLYEV